MEIKLICMDLDGTALLSDHKTFSPRLLRALDNAHAQGIAIAPVTGRPYRLLPEGLLAHPVWENLAVLCNGAQIRKLSTGDVLQRWDLSREALLGILSIAREFDLGAEFSLDSRLYLTEHTMDKVRTASTLTFHRETILPKSGVLVADLRSVCDFPVEKVNLLCIPTERRAAVAEALGKLPLSAVWSSPDAMEITHPEATKGNALLRLCRLLDIPLAQTMAMGDSGNDETMLRLAGFGVAMGNAPVFIQAMADAVTEGNDADGAAMAVERYALNL